MKSCWLHRWSIRKNCPMCSEQIFRIHLNWISYAPLCTCKLCSTARLSSFERIRVCSHNRNTKSSNSCRKHNRCDQEQIFLSKIKKEKLNTLTETIISESSKPVQISRYSEKTAKLLLMLCNERTSFLFELSERMKSCEVKSISRSLSIICKIHELNKITKSILFSKSN